MSSNTNINVVPFGKLKLEIYRAHGFETPWQEKPVHFNNFLKKLKLKVIFKNVLRFYKYKHIYYVYITPVPYYNVRSSILLWYFDKSESLSLDFNGGNLQKLKSMKV